MDDRSERLAEIAAAIRNLDRSPLYDYRQEQGYEPVPGEGDPGAELLFVGEAPGAKEAQTGRPFVGQAGRILDDLLQEAGIDRQEVYITSILKDRPPGNRDPTREEIETYGPFLLQQIEVIEPRIIAPLGRFAAHFILDHFDLPQADRRIGEIHGQVLTAQASYGPVTVIPLYHPAALLYNRGLEETMRDDFRTLREALDQPGE